MSCTDYAKELSWVAPHDICGLIGEFCAVETAYIIDLETFVRSNFPLYGFYEDRNMHYFFAIRDVFEYGSVVEVFPGGASADSFMLSMFTLFSWFLKSAKECGSDKTVTILSEHPPAE